MKGHIIFSGAALIFIAIYLKCSTTGTKSYNDKQKSLLLIQHHNGLRQEILKRHKDLIKFYKSLRGEFGVEHILPEVDPDLNALSERNLHVPTDKRVPKGSLGCEDLVHLTEINYVGSGFTKLVLKGTLLDGTTVALKSVHAEGNDMKQCIQLHGDHAGCHRLATYKLQKEVALLQILRHPGIIQLHGQCYHNGAASDIRVTAMLELGSPLEMIQLLQTPWEERFKICLELVRLLHYLANSPLGSLALLDFQPQQFVLVDGSLKVTDMDDAATEELTCLQDEDCTLGFPSRTFAIKCSAAGTCAGANEKKNLYNAYRFFFTYLLPHASPPELQPMLSDIMNATGNLRLGINETLEAFENVLNLYKSAKNPFSEPTYHKEYIVWDGYRVNETGNNFTCWPSYNHLGCLLSVHSADEAARFCARHANCRSFVIGQEKTWTGRLLASFTSRSFEFIPDVNSRVFIKRCNSSRQRVRPNQCVDLVK
ncbi:extracellular tyrosine-protein kinase PKDCC-like [Spea bombifrons]|uniref:extracellular tyrosine-protein kinase PKDCC-like n=1 Tax=Spea bombifrons TaxID=233779 RepID=UPI00234AECD6|nr:extracellular tyrosine-protein kinase PKDCC-like [Spea bombifrons]